jgi:hypothetical protein
MSESCPLSGAKRTWQLEIVMSANDPKRTNAQSRDSESMRGWGEDGSEVQAILRGHESHSL